MSGDSVVVVESVSKSFGETRALTGVSLDVAHGELFGLIGPDGAGKTTLFRILTTLMVPDTGTATVLGLDVVRDLWAIRARLGYMPGSFSLYPDLTVAENLSFFASVFGTTVEKGRQLIAPIYDQIAPFADRRADALSGGMKQKLALSCALVHRPDLLLLDEPTTGVDAVSRREFWAQLGELRRSGLTIVVSTPYMDEALRCDRVALIQGGHILDIDAPASIGRRFRHPLVGVRAANRYRVLQALRELPTAHSVYPFGEELHFADTRAELDVGALAAELTSRLVADGFTDVHVRPVVAGIEDVFMELMVHSPERAA
ncbi:MAG TPA: ABC transporter ATP-binding protein [Gemmatimonadaceae bacterium]|nr:ABC transporter ATP-binding protein [Gemmatimonadaceae bacterium]